MNILWCVESNFVYKISKSIFHISHKFLTHILENMHFTDFNLCVWFTLSFNYDLKTLSEMIPGTSLQNV